KCTHSCRALPRAASITSTIRARARLPEASVFRSNRLMTNKILTAGVFALIALAPACTDLTEVPQSAITPENFYRNADEALGGLASVYANLRTTNDEYYNISEISTDEMI